MVTMPEETHVTISDRIFARIQKEIVEGVLKPGSKISEPELARAYGISRGPLREAIGRLEACNLVVRKANVGARVVTAGYGTGAETIFYAALIVSCPVLIGVLVRLA